MTTAAICATREVSRRPSFYRGEQYDQDLGLYYLRARYYNPATGRFLSRDPLDGHEWDPKSLHKYLYAGGDPVNASDPTGKFMIEDALVYLDDLVDIAAARLTGAAVRKVLLCTAAALLGKFIGGPSWGGYAGSGLFGGLCGVLVM